MQVTQADILIVDDTPANLELLTELLSGRGYTTRPVTNGRLALRAARARRPDLILLDIDMPEMNGYEVCENLKADEGLKEVPVIFLTALTETVDKVKAFGVGGVDYVTKPFQFEEVEARVRTHLELVRQRRELEESCRRLKESERLRTNLVHMLVHDMRSPLTAMIAHLELLEDSLPPDGRELLGCSTDAARSLTAMITAILDVNRLEEGGMPLAPKECDLVLLAQQSLDSAGATGRRIPVVIERPDRPALAWADPEITRRILTNLVGNALKFTPSEREVRIALDADEHRVRVRVVDRGRGVPADALGRIFEKFGQVETAQPGIRYSTGLGLAFCKLAVEAQGGTIGVDSEVDRGSTFWFTLPVGGKR
ncbi:MAG: hybrid sensor histidine kinase/response regulator [Candidatus Riflebacteria bacterium]|nr:hybrid sensor histidine kinase/response regulator [Candidatus Riflebacteria bacterium]